MAKREPGGGSGASSPGAGSAQSGAGVSTHGRGQRLMVGPAPRTLRKMAMNLVGLTGVAML
jgi:hypothetical protein